MMKVGRQMGFHKIDTWTYYNKYRLTSYGNGANYAIDYIEADGSVTGVAYLQDDESVLLFSEALDECTNEEDFNELWSSYFFYDEEFHLSLKQTEYVED
jgi:hypothetical protein